MQPAVFSDASNKPDPFDGLSRYGFSVTMSGGPISFGSKKLPHVGLSAFHNEYMALRYFFALRATSAVPPFYTIDIAEVQRPCGPGPVAMRKQAGGVWPQRRGRCSCRGCAGRIIHLVGFNYHSR